MPELREVFEMTTKQVEPDVDTWREQEDRQRRASRNRKIGALAVTAAIGIVAAVIVIRIAGDTDRTQPAVAPTPTEAVVPEVDFAVDLDTGAIGPLPPAIVGEADETGDYAVSPDGTKIAYSGPDQDGTSQIFVANLDGTEVRQLTHDVQAIGPAWSPDGMKIAYSGLGDGTVLNIVVVDLATGETSQITFEDADAVGPRFSPDGSSIVYDTARPLHQWGVRIVPATGGKSTLLVGGGGLGEAGDGTLSPDGSLLAFGFSEESQANGTDIWISNADGSDPRPLVQGAPEYLLDPNWSPDGTRIAYFNDDTREVFVVDVSTGTTTLVAEGARPEWLDDDTLIVELTSGLPG